MPMLEYDPSRPLFFLHIPKTGGSSLRDLVRGWFGPGFHALFGDAGALRESRVRVPQEAGSVRRGHQEVPAVLSGTTLAASSTVSHSAWSGETTRNSSSGTSSTSARQNASTVSFRDWRRSWDVTPSVNQDIPRRNSSDYDEAVPEHLRDLFCKRHSLECEVYHHVHQIETREAGNMGVTVSRA